MHEAGCAMPILTIARQLGAGGGAVATALAERLGWRLLDRALIERIAAELKVEPEQVEPFNERVASFAERLGQYLGEGFPEMLAMPVEPPLSAETAARAARRVVSAAVDEGPAVIVGHGAQCVLQSHPDAFHLLVHAPLEFRVRRAVERFGVGEPEALERIRRSDADRRAYIGQHFGSEWLGSTLYHMTLDTGRLGIAEAVDTVEHAVRRYFRCSA
jgi:CMP/dCMP kinase